MVTEYATVNEAATILGVSHQTIRKYIKSGVLRADKIFDDRSYYISYDDLDLFAKEHKTGDAVKKKEVPGKVSMLSKFPVEQQRRIVEAYLCLVNLFEKATPGQRVYLRYNLLDLMHDKSRAEFINECYSMNPPWDVLEKGE